MTSEAKLLRDKNEMLDRARLLKRKRQWEAIAAMVDAIPRPVTPAWIELADEVAFALGQQRRTEEAVGLLEEVFSLEPTHRTASALAYLHYDALMELQLRRGKKSPEARESLRQGFTRWIQRALEMFPDSIKDLYRLGIYEAQLENAHDAVALRAFRAAARAYADLSDDERSRRGDLLKYYAKTLYAAGRSALRLDKVQLARRLSFDCIRVDREKDFVDPVHKFHLAAKACLAGGELDHAERALRLALDAKGPPRRDYLFGLLAEVARQRGDLDGAKLWITENVKAHKRTPALWRQLGDLHREAGELEEAAAAYNTSLQRDRMGRHLTLTRLGEIHLEKGRLGKAEKAFREAGRFRRRQYLGDHLPAIEGLIVVLEKLGKSDEARELQREMEQSGGRGGRREPPGYLDPESRGDEPPLPEAAHA